MLAIAAASPSVLAHTEYAITQNTKIAMQNVVVVSARILREA
jgi:hypothetical protein